ncbi:peroxisomal membrane protein PEX14-like [Glandiceps talaboti]
MASNPEGETSVVTQPVPATIGTANAPTMTTSPPRENMIDTAVKFLQNPKVRQSPFVQRKNFLQNKGLTPEEIQIAIDRSGTASDETNPPAPPQPAVPSMAQPPHPGAMVPAMPMAMAPPIRPLPPKSAWERWRDYIAVAVIVSGVTYGIVKFFKAYISPLLQSRKEEKEKLERIEVAISELNSNINITLGELKTTMERLQETLSEQTDKMQQISSSSKVSGTSPSTSAADQQSMSDIKAELVSLKGLILSRHQFPAAPNPSPIPAWQRAVTSESTTATTSVSTEEPPAQQENKASEPEDKTTDLANEEKPEILVNGDVDAEENGQHATSFEGQSSVNVKGQDETEEADMSGDIQNEQQSEVKGHDDSDGKLDLSSGQNEQLNGLGIIYPNKVKGQLKGESANIDTIENNSTHDEEVD